MALKKRGQPNQYRPYTAREQRRMVDLYEKGLTQNAIAAKFGCATKTVRKARQKYGVRIRQGKFSQRDYRQMVSLYEQGLSSVKIAEKFNSTASYVTQILRRLGVKMRPPGRIHDLSSDDSRRMVEMYQSGRTVQSIADEFGISGTPVTRLLREAGVKLRLGAGHPMFAKRSRRKMVTMYKNGLSLVKVATQFGCSITVVASALREYGVQARSNLPVSKFSSEDRNRMVALYQEGKTQREIAAILGCSRWAVVNALARQGIKCHSNRSSRYSDEDRNRMADMFQDGYTQQVIAKEFGCSLTLVNNLLQEPRRSVVPVSLAEPSEEILDALIRNFWQDSNRAVDMVTLPQENRVRILEHVRNALRYASEVLSAK